MKRRYNIFFYIFTAVLAVSGMGEALAQSPSDSLVRVGDALRMEYRFDESIRAYEEALEAEQDSLKMPAIDSLILLSVNGRTMSGYVYVPEVVARHRFSVDDFFLYYPLKEGSWRETPNQLDTVGGTFARALYAPAEDQAIYWSAEDKEGVRNVYMTEYQDTIWSAPALLNEQMVSDADEVYPVVSADGKSIYFSSAGLYGVGGYDLYVSRWDEEAQDWGAPENLGFPFSSPADDFIYVDTEDGRYTLFASNRDCPADSVWVYVLEYDSMPVRREITDSGELAELTRLRPVELPQRMDDASAVRAEIEENEDIRKYREINAHARALNDSLSQCLADVAEQRERLGRSRNEEERQKLISDIGDMEMYEIELRRRLETVKSERQHLEEEFLFSGIVIDPDRLMEEAGHEVVGEVTNYIFTKMHLGEPLEMHIAEPEPEFDYSLKVLPEGQFVENPVLPPGIVYQIQMFTSPNRAGVKDLKGLSPVFEHRYDSGNYTYRAGLFTSYSDALANINTVKKAGFRSAFIAAFIDGKEVKVAVARAGETAVEEEEDAYLYEVRVYPADGEMTPEQLEGLVLRASGKDVARTDDGEGGTVFVVGPFSTYAEAELAADFAEGMDIGEVSIEKNPKSPAGK